MKNPGAFKKRVMEEILNGSESLEYYSQKYHIGGSMTISRWIDKFATEEIPSMATKRKDPEELAELKTGLALLKREFEDERLCRQVYPLMVHEAQGYELFSARRKLNKYTRSLNN
jgi:transposase-like protein